LISPGIEWGFLLMQAIFFEDFKNSYIPNILDEIYLKKVYASYFEGKKDLTIIDCGANIGLFSLYAYDFAKKIYAIEPSEQHVRVLKRMIDFNKLADKVVVCQNAIFYEDKNMVLGHNQNTTMFSLNKNVMDKSLPTENVKAVTMETFFKENDINHVDFLKLDIEGAECEVVGGKGFENVADRIDAMVVEWHAWSGRNPSQLATTLEDYGFTVTALKADATLIGAVRK